MLRMKRELLQGAAPRRSPAGARPTRSERAAVKLVADWMRRSGLDTRALAALQDERRLEIERSVKEGRAEAVKQAATQFAAVRGHAKALQALAKKGGFFTVPSFTLDKPIRISADPRRILRQSRIKSFDSFAKMRVDRRQEGQDKLSFVFTFFNQTDAPVAIDAVTFLSASGFLDMTVGGGVVFNFGFLLAVAQIAVGPTESGSIPHEARTLGALSPFNNPLFPFDGHESTGAHGAFNLTALHHPVGPRQSVFIVVSVTIDSDCGSSFRSLADFESGVLGVSCPLVVVRVHRTPPAITPA
jgi:hypothetical protein